MRAEVTEAIFRRDRAIVAAALGALVLLAWAYVLHLARGMTTAMGAGGAMAAMDMAMPDPRSWGPVDAAFTFLMWVVMQIAMMVPSAVPMVLLFAMLSRRHAGARSPLSATLVFVLGYILVWTAFSAGATAAQWSLHTAALLSPMMAATSPVLGGVILIAAGVFQFTPLKHACLHRCRSPLGFLLSEWRDGRRGALTMGTRHGAYCVACCWLLMTLLFVAGVMNLLWIAGISIYVLIEKIAPGGHLIGRVAGVIVILCGAWMLVTGIPGAPPTPAVR